jgi:thymidylate synthase ThyX
MRLASYTEKSQRYCNVEHDGMYIPQELKPYGFEAYTASLAKSYKKLIALDIPLEDSRYVLPLAIKMQLGMTINAREACHLLRKCRSTSLPELWVFANALETKLQEVAPGLIRHTNAINNAVEKQDLYKSILSEIECTESQENNYNMPSGHMLVYNNPITQEILIAAALIARWTGADLTEVCNNISKRTPDLYENANEYMMYVAKPILYSLLWLRDEHELPPREFELGNVSADLKLSASAFAQLKRHRMMSLISCGGYKINENPIIPPTIAGNSEARSVFCEAMELTAKVALKIPSELHDHELIQYIATNANQKRVIMHSNFRELYHIAKLRMDSHAQWEIKYIVSDLINRCSREYPSLLAMACGKDEYDKYRDNLKKSISLIETKIQRLLQPIN